MNAVFNEIPGNDGVEPSADERIVAALLEKGRLKDADLARARRLQDDAGGSLLGAAGAAGPGVRTRHGRSRRPRCSACRWSAPRTCPELPPEDVPLSLRFLKQFHVVPVGEDAATASTCWSPIRRTPTPLEAVRLATGRAVRASIGLRSEIDDLIERYYGQGRSAMGAIVENVDDEAAATRTTSSTCATSPPRRRSSAWST